MSTKMQFLFKFLHEALEEDLINHQGKVQKYKEVNSIACSEEEARLKSKLSDEYKLSAKIPLPESWSK